VTTNHGYAVCDSTNVLMTIDNDNYEVLSDSKSEDEIIIDANPEEDIQFKCEEIGNAVDLNIKFCSDGNKEDNVCFDSPAYCRRNISLSDLRSSACAKCDEHCKATLILAHHPICNDSGCDISSTLKPESDNFTLIYRVKGLEGDYDHGASFENCSQNDTDWSFDGIDSCKENIYTMYNESNQPGKKSYKGLVEVKIMSSDGNMTKKCYVIWEFPVREKVLAKLPVREKGLAKWDWTLILTISPMSVLLIILASIIYHNKSKKKKFECFDIEKENWIKPLM